MSPGHVVLNSFKESNMECEKSSTQPKYLFNNENIFRDDQDNDETNIKRNRYFPGVNIKPYCTEGNNNKKKPIINMQMTENPKYQKVVDHQLSFNNDYVF